MAPTNRFAKYLPAPEPQPAAPVANRFAKYAQPANDAAPPQPDMSGVPSYMLRKPDVQPAPVDMQTMAANLGPAGVSAPPARNGPAATSYVDRGREHPISELAKPEWMRDAGPAAPEDMNPELAYQPDDPTWGRQYGDDFVTGVAGAPVDALNGLGDLAEGVGNLPAMGVKAFTGKQPYDLEIPDAPNYVRPTVTGALVRGATPWLVARGALGALEKGGGAASMMMKDAAAGAVSTDGDPGERLRVAGENALFSAPGVASEAMGALKNSARVKPWAVTDMPAPPAGRGVQAIDELMAADAMPEPPVAGPKPFSKDAAPKSTFSIGKDRIIGGAVGGGLGGLYDVLNQNADAAPGDGHHSSGPSGLEPLEGAAVGAFAPRILKRGIGRAMQDMTAARLLKKGGKAAVDAYEESVASKAVRALMKPVGGEANIVSEGTARYGDKPWNLADLSQEAIGTMSGLSRLPGKAGELTHARNIDLMEGRGGRIEGDVADITKMNPSAVSGDMEKMLADARAQATPQYNDLRANYSTISSPRLDHLAEKLPAVRDSVASVKAYKDDLFHSKGEGMSDFEFWDLVKRDLDAKQTKLLAKPGANPNDIDVQRINNGRTELVAEMDRMTGGQYAAAREAGGEAPRMEAAFAEGQGYLGGKYKTADDVVRAIGEWTGQPLTAARAGVVRSIVAKTEGSGASIAALRSRGAQKRLAAVFGDEQGAALQKRFAADAAIIANSVPQVAGIGSQTSRAMMGGGGIGGAIGTAVDLVKHPGSAPGIVLNMLKDAGYSKGVRDKIAEMLTEGATPENLARIYRKKGPSVSDLMDDGLPPSAGTARPNPFDDLTGDEPPVPPTRMGASAGKPSLKRDLMAGVATSAAASPLVGPPDADGDGITTPEEYAAWVSKNAIAGLGGAGASRLLGGLKRAGPAIEAEQNAMWPFGKKAGGGEGAAKSRIAPEPMPSQPRLKVVSNNGGAPRAVSAVPNSPAKENGGSVKFTTPSGRKIAVDFDPDASGSTGVHFAPLDRAGAPESTSLTEAQEILRGVVNAVSDDIAQGGRTEYKFIGNDEQKRRVFAMLSKRTPAPEGYRWEVGTSKAGDQYPKLVRGKRSLSDELMEDDGPPLMGGTPEALQRAKAMGFDTDTPLYHGTAADFPSFDPTKRGSNSPRFDADAKQAFFFSTSPDIASQYAEEAGGVAARRRAPANGLGDNEGWDNIKRDSQNGQAVLPSYARLKKPYVVDYIHEYDTDLVNEAIQHAKATGHDGVIFKGMNDALRRGAKPGDVYAIFNPENVRSRFAKFDPKKKDSADLLAALPLGAGMGSAALASMLMQDDEPPARR